MCPGDVRYIEGAVNPGSSAPEGPFDATVTGTGATSGQRVIAKDSARVEVVAAPSSSPAQVPSLPPAPGCLACDGGEVVFHFSPFEGKWQTHLQIARMMGCELASIKSAKEQQAAVAALEPFRDFPYSNQDGWNNAFVFIGGKIVESKTDISAGNYTFEWTDGSGEFTSQTNINTVSPYTNFKGNDPNGRTTPVGFSDEPYLALSLDEGSSSGIPRGLWVDYSNQLSPALYKCCGPPKKDFSTCSVGSCR
jgi:hypothetical protein